MKYIKSLYIILCSMVLFVFDVVITVFAIILMAVIVVPAIDGVLYYYQTVSKLKGIK